jgi:hypothetical protein
MKKFLSLFTSLKLTVTLLAFAIVLVFVGTIAQADEGLYGAQAHYFKQWIVVGANFFGHYIPLLLPGGYLLGTLLLVNLVCAHIQRFQFTTKKIGIQLAHSGVIVLLVGQLATDMFSRELQMHFFEGETRNYSDSATDYELVFIQSNLVTAIAGKMLKPGRELSPEQTGLPFSLRVKNYWRNSDVNFRAPMMQNRPPLASNGVALHFDFRPAADVKTTDERNVPTIVFNLAAKNVSLGDWVASGLAGDPGIAQQFQKQFSAMVGPEMAEKIAGELLAPQGVAADGKKFTFAVRPAREVHPFSFTLLKATHTVYPGTITSINPEGIPKDFRSRVSIDNPQTGEHHREVEISMNHPLRYGGFTYYQYQMSAGEMVERAGVTSSSVLQVVRNPSWLTPYVGCAMVGAGLLVQFLKHLVGFISKRKAK